MTISTTNPKPRFWIFCSIDSKSDVIIITNCYNKANAQLKLLLGDISNHYRWRGTIPFSKNYSEYMRYKKYFGLVG